MPSTATEVTSTGQPEKPPQADPRTRIWRRSTSAPVPAGHTGPDGKPDYGYFGPGSTTWKVYLHPWVSPMIVGVTAMLELSHEGLMAVLMDHDPMMTKAPSGGTTFDDSVKRIQRTAGVPVPVIFGDTATADRIAKHLRNFHRKMKGVIPGTDRAYDAGGTELMLFAHVTIMHSALRIYENMPSPGRPIPRRLPKAERDQFWAELKKFGELMGADPDEIPVTADEVAAYYRSIEDRYRPVQGQQAANRKQQWSILKNAREYGGITGVLVGAITALTMIPTVAAIPPNARRHMGIPRIADPILKVLLRLSQPLFFPLTWRPIAREIIRLYIGDDGVILADNAIALNRSQPSR